MLLTICRLIVSLFAALFGGVGFAVVFNTDGNANRYLLLSVLAGWASGCLVWWLLGG